MTVPIAILVMLGIIFLLMVVLAVMLVRLILRLDRLNRSTVKEIDHLYKRLEGLQKEFTEFKEQATHQIYVEPKTDYKFIRVEE